jgi:hypothetical protein
MVGENSNAATLPDKDASNAGRDGYALLVVNEAGLRVVALPRSGVIVVGRGKRADVQVADAQMSRRHVRIHVGASFRVEDLGSFNGTTIGSQPVPSGGQRVLAPGESIQVGTTTMIIRTRWNSAAAAKIEPAPCQSMINDSDARALALAGLSAASNAVGEPPATWATVPERPPSSNVTSRAARRHVILFLAAHPSGTTQLALSEECAAIEDELARTQARDDFEFRSKWTVSVDDMMRHLNAYQPTIVHFSGHGGGVDDVRVQAPEQAAHHVQRDIVVALPDGAIQLEDDGRQPQYVTGHLLAQMIASASRATRVVVLNACFSDAMAEPLCAAVDCVVGMRGAIGDEAARSFAVAFYRALGYRTSVKTAVSQAIVTLALKHLPDAQLPVCRARVGVDPDRVVLPAVHSP